MSKRKVSRWDLRVSYKHVKVSREEGASSVAIGLRPCNEHGKAIEEVELSHEGEHVFKAAVEAAEIQNNTNSTNDKLDRPEDQPWPDWPQGEILVIKRKVNGHSNVNEDVLAKSIGKDALERVLALLDVKTVTRCQAVCKWWESTILSSHFRVLWQSMSAIRPMEKAIAVLSSVDNEVPIVKWSPTSISPFLEVSSICRRFGDTLEVVASADGLLCLRSRKVTNCEYVEMQLIVGNPVTQEWQCLPSISEGLFEKQFQLDILDHVSGAYSLTVYYDEKNYGMCMVYDSAANLWAYNHFTAGKNHYYDAKQCAWVKFPRGLEDYGGVSICEWQHKGQWYIGAVQNSGKLAQDAPKYWENCYVGVWKWRPETQTFDEIVGDPVYFPALETVPCYVINCSAGNNFFCFSGIGYHVNRLPASILDVENKIWYHHIKHPKTASTYVLAIMYRPSFVPVGRPTVPPAPFYLGIEPKTHDKLDITFYASMKKHRVRLGLE